MKVTSISLFSDTEESMHFDLRSVDSRSRYMIRSIVGIDVDELTPRFYGFSKDGTKRFYEFKLRPREIVMRLVLNPRFEISEDYSVLRDAIYKAISATRSGELRIQFHSGAAVVAETYGHIVKMEAAHFSQVPELQITIRCNDPMLRAINDVRMEDAEIVNTNPIVVADSISTAPHGLYIRLTFTGTVASFTLQDKSSSPEWDFKITPASSFLSGDVLHISSEFNNKQLYMVRSAVTTHLMDRIDPTSSWPIVFPGFNEFHFVNIASLDLDEISFRPAFWGV